MSKITISTDHPDAGHIYAEAYATALGREAALRVDLATVYSDRDAEKEMKAKARDQRDVQTIRACELQRRLTVAEQRVDLLEGLLKSGSSPTYAHCSAVMEALKPAAKPHKCIECDSQYCHGVCVERGDDDERYKGAEGEGS